MISATLPKRGVDAWGDGAFGASRGHRKHKGIDYACYPGTEIRCDKVGVVSKLGYPYSDDLAYRYVEVTTTNRLRHRYFYVEPRVKVGDLIRKGQVIGESQDISSRYRDPGKPPMINHVHYEVLEQDGTPVDPEDV